MGISRDEYRELLDKHQPPYTSKKKLRPGGNPESKRVKHILEMLLAKGIKAGKTKTMGVLRKGVFCYDKFLFRGFPDITGFADPVGIFFIEVKNSPKDKLRPAQEHFRVECYKYKIKHITACSWEEVEIKMKEWEV